MLAVGVGGNCVAEDCDRVVALEKVEFIEPAVDHKLAFPDDPELVEETEILARWFGGNAFGRLVGEKTVRAYWLACDGIWALSPMPC